MIIYSVISTDGIYAYWPSRVVRYYVGQKWRNLKPPAVKIPTKKSRYGSIQLERIPLVLLDFSTFVQHRTGLHDRVVKHKSRRSKWRKRRESHSENLRNMSNLSHLGNLQKRLSKAHLLYARICLSMYFQIPSVEMTETVRGTFGEPEKLEKPKPLEQPANKNAWAKPLYFTQAF